MSNAVGTSAVASQEAHSTWTLFVPRHVANVTLASGCVPKHSWYVNSTLPLESKAGTATPPLKKSNASPTESHVDVLGSYVLPHAVPHAV